MSDPTDGLLDTNVSVHALTTDQLSEECRGSVRGLAEGSIHARLNPLVLHELTYVLPRYLKQDGAAAVIEYLRARLSWPGVHREIALMDDALRRWAANPGLSFVDAYLCARPPTMAARSTPRTSATLPARASRFPIRCRPLGPID